MRWLLLSLLACSSGFRPCLREPEIATVYASVSFTADEREAIHEASRAWAECSCQKLFIVRFILQESAKPEDYRQAKNAHYMFRVHEREIAAAGLYENPIVFIAWDSKKSVRRVAAHEIGHMLGMPHTNGGVMNPEETTEEIYEEDFRVCKDLGFCDP